MFSIFGKPKPERNLPIDDIVANAVATLNVNDRTEFFDDSIKSLFTKICFETCSNYRAVNVPDKVLQTIANTFCRAFWAVQLWEPVEILKTIDERNIWDYVHPAIEAIYTESCLRQAADGAAINKVAEDLAKELRRG